VSRSKPKGAALVFVSRSHKLLGAGLHEAYMAGLFKAEREQYLLEARREREQSVRCYIVRCARAAHRQYRKQLAEAFKANSLRH
jgi:hypothetical protein